MYEHIFYESIEIKADKPIDKRLYIDDITVPNLQALFETDGRYSFDSLVLFNRTDKQFYYLGTRTVPADALVVGNWVPITSSASGFTLYVPTSTYVIGSTVYEIDGGSVKHFFIATDTIAAGETPLTTPAKWLEVNAINAIWQQSMHRIDPAVPAGNATRDFEITVNADLSTSHNPIVTFYADTNVRISGQIAWSRIEPAYQVYTAAGVTKIKTTFTGTLTDFYYDSGDATQMNIMAEIR